MNMEDEYDINDPTERWEKGIVMSGHWCHEHRHWMTGSINPVCLECENERREREWKIKLQDLEQEVQRLTLEIIEARKSKKEG